MSNLSMESIVLPCQYNYLAMTPTHSHTLFSLVNLQYFSLHMPAVLVLLFFLGLYRSQFIVIQYYHPSKTHISKKKIFLFCIKRPILVNSSYQPYHYTDWIDWRSITLLGWSTSISYGLIFVPSVISLSSDC